MRWLFVATITLLGVSSLSSMASARGSRGKARRQAARVPRAASIVKGAIDPQAPVYSLKRCLELAEANYPKVQEKKARLRYVKAQLFEAQTAPFSGFKASGGVGPAPTVRGTSVYSPNSDVALTSDLGLAWQIGIEGAIPLWTFGKITNLRDAAKHQVQAGVHAVQKEKNEVRLTVYKAYWGMQLAQDSLLLVDEAAKRIDKHLSRMQKLVDEGEGDDIELLKLKMNRADLRARRSEAQKQARIAESGLRFLTGIGEDFAISAEPLDQVTHRLAPLPRYLRAARLFRPEINMARAGILARRAQVRMQRARYLPDIALGLSAKYARAPEVADQRNPFVKDGANFFFYGAALVMRWNLDLLPQSARVAQAQAQLEEMRAVERYAVGGVAHEVEKAYEGALDAQRKLDAYSEATTYAKQWLIKVQQGIDIGTMDDEDIVSPSKEYALKKFSRMSAVYEYNVAIANLAMVTGWDDALPRD